MPLLEEHELSPLSIIAADKLALEVLHLVRAGKVGDRSPVADALLEFATTHFGSGEPMQKLAKRVEQYNNKTPRSG